VGHRLSEREVDSHSWTAPANGPPHSNVITRRNVSAKDPQLPVAPAEPRHSQFVPGPASRAPTRTHASKNRDPRGSVAEPRDLPAAS
jgi:hypothetical protein